MTFQNFEIYCTTLSVPIHPGFCAECQDVCIERETLDLHLLNRQLGRCKENNHSLCEGDCDRCAGKVMTPGEMEIWDRFVFFCPEYENGKDTPEVHAVDLQDYAQCASAIGCRVVG